MKGLQKMVTRAVYGTIAFGLLMAGCSSAVQQTSAPQSSVPQSGTSNQVEYPTKSIEFVVPYSAGGGVDLVARATAEYLSKEWGQSVTVVNKAGGGGTVGAEYALKQASNDGYTVLANNVSNTSMLAGGMKNPAVKNEDNLYTARIGQGTLAFAVKADAPWKDFREFCEWVKQNPEQLTWTSVGPAGFSAFGVAEWLDALGVDYKKTRMIVTKGASDSMPKVAGGHAVLAVHTIGEINSMLKSSKVKVLAVSGNKRSPFLPDVPTAEEQGVKGLTVTWWTGISLPKGTPEAIVKKWESTVEKMVQDPGFIEKLKTLQVEPTYANSADFTKLVKDETNYYTELATKRGMRQ